MNIKTLPSENMNYKTMKINVHHLVFHDKIVQDYYLCICVAAYWQQEENTPKAYLWSTPSRLP